MTIIAIFIIREINVIDTIRDVYVHKAEWGPREESAVSACGGDWSEWVFTKQKRHGV